MRRISPSARLLIAPLLLQTFGCARPVEISARDAADAADTGGTLGASTPLERELLRQVARMPSGAEQRLAGVSVVAEPPYDAASGRTCRALRIRAEHPPDQGRLACSDGHGWFFVPGVFGDALVSER